MGTGQTIRRGVASALAAVDAVVARWTAMLLLVLGATMLVVNGPEEVFSFSPECACACAAAVALAGYGLARRRIAERRRPWVFLAVMLLVVGLLGYAWWPPPRTFEPSAWKAAGRYGRQWRRRGMAEDLNALLRQGTIASRSAALNALGPPDGASKDGVLAWDLGPAQWFVPIDELHLVLGFDQTGRLVSHRIRMW